MNKKEFFRKGIYSLGVTSTIMGASLPSLVGNSYTIDDYKIYSLVKFLGIDFLINFVKKHVESWCISANCKEIKKFFEESVEEEFAEKNEKNGKNDKYLKRTIDFDFGKDMRVEFNLYALKENPSVISLHKCFLVRNKANEKNGEKEKYSLEKIDKFRYLDEYDSSVSALRNLENMRFLSEVYKGFTEIGFAPVLEDFYSGVVFEVKGPKGSLESCKLKIKLNADSQIPAKLKVEYCDSSGCSHFYNLSFGGSCEDKTYLTIDEMKKIIDQVKDFYIENKPKNEENVDAEIANNIINNN